MKLLFLGLGRIGLPQALVFADSGHTVFGYDIEKGVLDQLNDRIVPFNEPHMEEYLCKTLDRSFFPITDWRCRIHEVEAVFFTLGTKAPDAESCLKDQSLNLPSIKHLLAEMFAVPGERKRPLALIFRTTLPIGSTDKLRQFLETSLSLKYGQDFYIAFVPERLMEGNAIEEEQRLPKIVGTYCESAFELISAIFEPVGGTIIRVSSPRAAEFCKLTDNSFRNTTFAFANEVAMTASALALDAKEVLEAVNADYGRNRIPTPGYVSGYCLGKDPYIFEYAFNECFRDRGFQSLWYYGRKTNDYLIEYTAERVIASLRSLSKNIENARISILGLSFKNDVDDFRMSHAFQIIERLMDFGCFRFRVYDPSLNRNRYTQLPASFEAFIESYDDKIDNPDLYRQTDAVIIAHQHSEIAAANTVCQMQKIRALANPPLYVFDGWNVWRQAQNVEGIRYESLGFRGAVE